MTLKDVALKANCSVATVSKALKNSSEISSDAKQRILAVAKECGYLKKATTRTAVLGGFKTVIFNDVKGEFLKLYSDLQKLAKKQGLIALYVIRFFDKIYTFKYFVKVNLLVNNLHILIWYCFNIHSYIIY